MSIAQRLYEGIELGQEGPVGLITYMRTDSVRIAPEALAAVRQFIQEKFGADYLPEKPNFYKSRKTAQDAHPDTSGYEVLPEISHSTDAKILVLTILESDHNIRAAFDAGADGYCFKDVSTQELIHAISSFLAGERYLSRPTLSYPGERRAEQRQACDCHIVWAYFNKDNLVSARMVNCSRAGCYFETAQQLTPGSTVLVRLERSAAGSEKTVSGPVRSSAVAEVNWCDNRDHQYGVGVRYHFSG